MGFHVNFFKSSLIIVNADHIFLSSNVDFLHYETYDFSFKYIALPMGVNPHLESTSDPLFALLEEDLTLGSINM